MRLSALLSSTLLMIVIIGCQSSDRQTMALRGSGHSEERASKTALATFSSAADSSEQVRLQLYTDSTFELGFSSEQHRQARKIEGKLAITDDHYQLFFPDTVAHLNELLTPVHHDASVVVYPDGSIALDRALTQLFAEGTLIKIAPSTPKSSPSQ